MMEKAHPGMLDREYIDRLISDNFKEQCEVLDEIVSHGTNCIVRFWETSDKQLLSYIIFGVLLNKAVAIFDSIVILISKGSPVSCEILARVLFEIKYYILFMMDNNHISSSEYFYVAELRSQIHSSNRVIHGTPEFDYFNERRKKLLGIDDNFELDINPELAINNIKKILYEKYQHINDKFEKMKKQYDKKWYQVYSNNKIRSLRHLSEAIGLQSEYDLAYSMLSEEVHTSNFNGRIVYGSGKAAFRPIRSSDKIKPTISVSCYAYFSILESLFTNYRPGEYETYRSKFLEWSAVLMNTPEIDSHVFKNK